jgi:uncharacterized membrane protein YhfC
MSMAPTLDAWKIGGLAFQAALSLLVPIGAVVYLRRRQHISGRPLLVGVGVFVVFALLLEGSLNYYVLNINAATEAWLRPVFAYAAYGAFAAGVFEELGRYLGFTVLLRRNRELRDGLAYGTGHGGIEAILLGAVSSIQALIVVLTLHSGRTPIMPAAALELLTKQFAAASRLMFYVGGLERLFAFAIQIGLSLLVLLAVRKGRVGFLLLAIGLHAVVDVPAALYQRAAAPLWIAETVAGVAAAVAACAVLTSSKWWPRAAASSREEGGAGPSGERKT